MGVSLERREESITIHMEGAVDIASAAELKTFLLQALKSDKEVCISLDDATYLDVTSIELLWAAEREAKGSGAKFSLTGPVPEQICADLVSAGFEKFSAPLNVL